MAGAQRRKYARRRERSQGCAETPLRQGNGDWGTGFTADTADYLIGTSLRRVWLSAVWGRDGRTPGHPIRELFIWLQCVLVTGMVVAASI